MIQLAVELWIVTIKLQVAGVGYSFLASRLSDHWSLSETVGITDSIAPVGCSP